MKGSTRLLKWLALLLPLLLGAGLLSSQTVPLTPGDTALVTCSNQLQVTVQPNSINAVCSTSVPPSPTPTQVVACCDAFWHPQSGGYEHGDGPPAWLAAAGIVPSFNWIGNTPNENSLSTKHSGFKGFAGTLNGENIYLIAHFDTNPGGEFSIFHSYQLWIQDKTGAISYIANWMYFGAPGTNQTSPTLVGYGCGDQGTRPVMLVNYQICPNGAPPAGKAFDTWYPSPAGYNGVEGWAPDMGLSASPIYYAGGLASDMSTWVPTGGLNLSRRLELSWYADRSSMRGYFYSTQFGEIVSGPTDPLCGTTKMVGARTYTRFCVQEYIAPTLTTIQFPNNNFSRNYSTVGINLPN